MSGQEIAGFIFGGMIGLFVVILMCAANLNNDPLEQRRRYRDGTATSVPPTPPPRGGSSVQKPSNK